MENGKWKMENGKWKMERGMKMKMGVSVGIDVTLKYVMPSM